MAKKPIGTIVDSFTDNPIDTGGIASSDDKRIAVNTDDIRAERINGYTTYQPDTEPGNTTGNTDSGTTGAKRGRPRGSRNGTYAKTAKTGAVTSLENILLSLHFFGAVLLQTPELELTEEELKKLATAMARVSSLYDDRINPKLVAWVDLACVAGAVYGPRAIAIGARMKQEAAAARRAAPIVMQRMDGNAHANANASAKDTAAKAARSPADMFGDFYSANISDVG